MSLYCIESKCTSQCSSRSSRSKLHSVEAAAMEEAHCPCWYLLDLNGARVNECGEVRACQSARAEDKLRAASAGSACGASDKRSVRQLRSMTPPLRVLFLTLEFSAATFSGNGVYAQSQVSIEVPQCLSLQCNT